MLQELAKIAFASMREFISIDLDGQPQIDLCNATDDDLDALSEVVTETVLERDGTEPVTGGARFNRIRKTQIKIKLHDKLAALEKLAQHTGVYRKRDDNFANALVSCVAEIQARTSKAPINRGTRDKASDNFRVTTHENFRILE